jgi:DNA-binding transcriptional ArsR family regulator
MAVVLRFGQAALLRCRFAVSPLHEATDALRSFTHPGREAYHLPWQREVRPRLAALGVQPLLALMPHDSYQPDFLSPPPDGPFTEIDGELARVRATPPAQVAAELARCLEFHPARRQVTSRFPELSADPETVRDLLADLLHRAWEVLVKPWWPQLRDVLDADITYRARQLADAGIESTLSDLDPKIRWRAGALHVAVSAAAERDLGDDGIVLLPSVFNWPAVGVMLDPPWQPTVVYPARGIASLWRPPAGSSVDLARLLGRTRATVLTALAEPASTTGLAARCRLPVSSVSEHLTVLRGTGLVSTTRAGRFLVHQRTPLGVALAGSASAGVSRGARPRQPSRSG